MNSTALEQILANKNIALKALGQNPQLVDPMGSYLVLKMVQPDKTSYGGIVLTDQTLENKKPLLAEVIKVGPGQRGMMDGKHIPPMVKPGDLVLVTKHTAYEINLNGEIFWVGFEGDLLGVIDQTALAALVVAEKARLDAEALRLRLEKEAEEAAKGKVVEKLDDGEIRERPSGILIATAGA